MSRFRRSALAVAASVLVAAGVGVSWMTVSAVPAPPPGPARVDATLRAVLDGSAASDRIGVFVHGSDDDVAEDAVATAGLRRVETFDRIDVVFAFGTPAQITALQAVPGITYLESDRPLAPAQETSHVATRMVQAAEEYTAADGTPLDGSGVSVAIVDSGVRGDHPSFGDRVKVNLKYLCPSPACFELETQGDTRDELWVPAEDSDTASAGGHGTHVAGIAAAGESTTLDGVTFRGAAPGADVIALSVGTGLSVYGASSALNWIIEHGDDPCDTCAPIRVVNNSYGPVVDPVTNEASPFDPDGVTAKLQAELVDKDVTVVWAAGNDGGEGDEDRVNPAAKDPRPGIIGVANYDDGETANRDNVLDTSSSRGLKTDPTTWPDISAPGSNILSTCGPAIAICRGTYVNDPDYGIISGTSMAAPHIAGYVAILLEANPSLTPGQIEFLLEETAHKFTFGLPYEDDPRHPGFTSSADKGHGLVDMAAAVAVAQGLPVPLADSTAPVCAAGSSATSDVSGDAPLVVGPSNPNLDLVRVELREFGDRLMGTFHVEDLRGDADPPTHPGTGEAFDLGFTFGGQPYYFRAQRQFPGAGTYALRKPAGANGTGDTDVATGTGSFDGAANVVTISVPISAVPGLVPGAELTSLTATSWSVEGRLLLRADQAALPCPMQMRAASAPGDSSGPGETAGGETQAGGDGDRPGATAGEGGDGYRMVAADGGIFTFGERRFHGSTGSLVLNKPIVGGATDISDYDGYWIVASDGGVFTFDAEFHGSLAGQTLAAPAVEIEPTPSGKGYWIVLANGKVYTFGDANFFGDISSSRLNKPVIGMSVTPSGKGYWLVAEDGGIFNYGDAGFFGSMGDKVLNAPVIDLAPAVDNKGYYLLGRDGGVFTFGTADFKGSTGSMTLNAPVIAMLTTPSGSGYWLAASDGGIFTFGPGAAFLGSMGGTKLNSPVLDLIN